jgi:hypothetical protein
VGLTLLHVPEAGYVFQRPAHLVVVFTPIVVAWFIVSRASGTLQGVSLAALTILTFPIAGGFNVHHEASVETFVPRLVARMKTATGPMVLLENNPHREVSTPPGRSEKSLYGTHYEALIPDAIGKRLYAAYWDGWMFTPFRGEMVAGGAWQGHMLRPDDRPAFVQELRRWGIHDLFVWSNAAKAALSGWPELRMTWADGPWRHFELTDTPIDLRTVVTGHGSGDLVERDPLGGRVRLSGVQAGDSVVVRTHYHPAWKATGPSGAIHLRDAGGQLGFAAPAEGDYDVVLSYPGRRGLLVLAGLILAVVALVDWSRGRGARRS